MSYMNLVNAADELKNLLMIIIKALFMDYISYVAKKTTVLSNVLQSAFNSNSNQVIFILSCLFLYNVKTSDLFKFLSSNFSSPCVTRLFFYQICQQLRNSRPPKHELMQIA